jgi:hypothetical protein
VNGSLSGHRKGLGRFGGRSVGFEVRLRDDLGGILEDQHLLLLQHGGDI